MRAMSWWGKCALVGMGIIALLAFFAPFVAPYAPDMQDLDNILAPASAAHWCGSDYLVGIFSLVFSMEQDSH